MSDSAVIAAEGHPVTLADGTVVPLRYTMRAVMAMEKEWGSLAHFQLAVHRAKNAVEAAQALTAAGQLKPDGTRHPDATPEQVEAAKEAGPLFTTVFKAMALGLPRSIQLNSGGTLRSDDVDAVADMVDPRRLLSKYFPAFGAALAEAFGGGGVNPPAQATPESDPSSSPGPSGTTSPPSPSDAPTTSSGG